MSINTNDLLSNPWAIAIGSPIILALLWAIFKKIMYKTNKIASQVSPVFWRFYKYKILAVHKYVKSNALSGYDHESQNSRSDQWQELIDISSKFFNIRHEVIPKNKKDILAVIISRNGREQWKTINFNKK